MIVANDQRTKRAPGDKLSQSLKMIQATWKKQYNCYRETHYRYYRFHILLYRMMWGNSKVGSVKSMGVVSSSVRKDLKNVSLFLLEFHGTGHVCCWSGERHCSQWEEIMVECWVRTCLGCRLGSWNLELLVTILWTNLFHSLHAYGTRSYFCTNYSNCQDFFFSFFQHMW